MTELTTARIKSHATKLGLPHLAASLEQLVKRADTEQLGYLDFLDLIVEEELGIREGRRFRQALRLSKLPHHKTLDTRKVRDLASLSFIATKSNVALLGPPGVGKTHLAVALAVSACRAGYSTYFTSLDDMVRQLRAAEELGRLNRKMRTYTRPAILVVDEVGYLPLDRSDANLVFQMISKRYETGPIILTSNKSFSEWGQVFCDDVLATAILDRVLHHCEVLSINGPSYRLKHRLTAIEGGDTTVA
jgi:DNA replication protein DnaC